MTTLIVLFNLKPDADRAAYEHWAQTTDLPTVRGMSNCESFDALRVSSLFGGGEAPYQYVEVIKLSDLEGFKGELDSDVMRKVAGEFHTFADGPTFMLTESIEA